jgi:hypothetical protein
MDAQHPMSDRARGSALLRPSAADQLLTISIVTLTLATAAVHAYLGGLLFLANAAGYTTLAIALVVPLQIGHRYRWLVRLALLGFTAATMLGWLVFGARIPLAYLDKGIEAILVGALVAQIYRLDGAPMDVLRLVTGLVRDLAGRITGRPAR